MDDSLRQLLSEHRAAIIERWRDLIVGSYAPETSRFLKANPDPFENPVGATVARVVDVFYDGIAEERDLKELAPAVEEICRLRAVQSFSAARAVAFLPLLKDVLHEALELDRLEAPALRSLVELEGRIDQLTLLAFDTYCRCRERVFEIKATEIRSRSQRVLERLNDRLLSRSPEGDSNTPRPVSDGKGGETT